MYAKIPKIKIFPGLIGNLLEGLVLFASDGESLSVSCRSLDDAFSASTSECLDFADRGAVDDGLREPKLGGCWVVSFLCR